MINILSATDSQSAEFVSGTERWGFLLVSNGGSWQLQLQDPDGTWHAIPDATYTATNIYVYQGIEGIPMRFVGGTVGAKIWAQDVRVLGS